MTEFKKGDRVLVRVGGRETWTYEATFEKVDPADSTKAFVEFRGVTQRVNVTRLSAA